MMKKLVLLCIALCPMAVLGTTGKVGKNPLYEDRFWSYGALADAMRDMRNYCEPTIEGPFVRIGNWMRTNGANFSIYDLLTLCLLSDFQPIDRTSTEPKLDKVVPTCELPNKACHLDGTTGKYDCGEKKMYSDEEYDWFDNAGTCDIFYATFMKYNNERAKILQDRKPGTYVSNVRDGVYRVVDVVLADDYWIRDYKNTPNFVLDSSARVTHRPEDDINYDSNTNEANTKIWEIMKDGTLRETGWHTWTNDMFLGVKTAKDPAGNVTGAFTNSLIFTEEDVTRGVYEGVMAVGASPADLPAYICKATTLTKICEVDNAHNPKEWGVQRGINSAIRDKYTGELREQYPVETHSNGVMFDGKIAMLDWLGNFIVGMNIDKIVGRWHEKLENGEYTDNGKKLEKAAIQTVHTAQGLVSGKTSKTEREPEPDKAQLAWRQGKEYFNGIEVLYGLSDAYVDTAREANEMAEGLVARWFKLDYLLKSTIACDADCGRPNSVLCEFDTPDTKGKRVLIKFGGVCKKLIEQHPGAGAQQHDSMKYLTLPGME